MASFNEYEQGGGKESSDFYIFSKVAKLRKNKEHLTHKGLNEIKDLKRTMNKYDTIIEGRENRKPVHAQ